MMISKWAVYWALDTFVEMRAALHKELADEVPYGEVNVIAAILTVAACIEDKETDEGRTTGM